MSRPTARINMQLGDRIVRVVRSLSGRRLTREQIHAAGLIDSKGFATKKGRNALRAFDSGRDGAMDYYLKTFEKPRKRLLAYRI